MAQAYLSTNEYTYIWHKCSDRMKSAKPHEVIYHKEPKGDIWLKTKVKDGTKQFEASDLKKMKKFVSALYRKRNWTTYQVSFCKSQISSLKHEEEDEEESKSTENELLEYGKRLYSKRTQRIMKPLATSRKRKLNPQGVMLLLGGNLMPLNGYMNPMNLYTGLSEYEYRISKLGYELLNENYEKRNY